MTLNKMLFIHTITSQRLIGTLNVTYKLHLSKTYTHSIYMKSYVKTKTMLTTKHFEMVLQSIYIPNSKTVKIHRYVYSQFFNFCYNLKSFQGQIMYKCLIIGRMKLNFKKKIWAEPVQILFYNSHMILNIYHKYAFHF